MSQFSDNRFVAAMTTITIFLPTAILNQPPISDLIAAEKILVLHPPQKKLSRNCKIKVLPFSILCLTTAAFADDFKLVTGKEYKNVTVTRVEPDGIVLKTKSGISKVYFVEFRR
jgi:hypothetical protein